jgi:hypothetical protein
MKRFAFRLVAVIAGWLLVELAAVALLWILDGAFPAWPRLRAERAAVTAPAAGNETVGGSAESASEELARLAQGGENEEVLQPYLGYVVNPEINEAEKRREKGRLLVSPLGFFQPAAGAGRGPAATAPPGEPVRVGIFGGSVAFIFSFVSRDRLAADLASIPTFAGRPIAIESFALGGYKQPQQLQALTYLLALGKDFDLVINIDGFNEVVLPSVKNAPEGVFPFYPSSWPTKVRQIPDVGVQNLRGEIAYLRETRRRRAELCSRPWLSVSFLANLLWQLQDRRLVTQIAAAERAAESYKPALRRYLTDGPERTYADDSALFADLAAVWERSSLQMSRLCAANGIRYYHFLQPNQYVPGSKPLSAEERKSAFDPDHPYAKAVVAGYPLLIAAGRQLAAEGVHYADLTGLFKGHRETLYFDDCCHFNQAGGDLMADAVAARIRADFEETPSSTTAHPGSD